MKIIGISGPPCSGKDTAAEYIEKRYDFRRVSTGDLIRAKARQLNIGQDRTSLQLLGARLRDDNNGHDPLLTEALKAVHSDTVFTGIRTLGAARAILGLDMGSILYIDAPLEDRYERSISRDRNDHGSYSEFLHQDEIEHTGSASIDTALLAVKSLAKAVIVNDRSVRAFMHEIDNFVSKDVY